MSGANVLRPLFAIRARIRSIRNHPALYAAVREERRIAGAGGHPVDEGHEVHAVAALDWLCRAQDATPDDGVARGYSIVWNSYFGSRGWQPSYPETTGYIIPTFLWAARWLNRAEFVERAVRAARWEIEVQLPSGAVRGGVIGQGDSPEVFNTGQVILGWLGVYRHNGDENCARAAVRAGRFLVDNLDDDGLWRSGNSRFARSDATLYNARVAWALAAAGRMLEEPDFLEGAARNLRAVVALQRENGWFPHCCLVDPERPLLHTLAYTTRGLLEGGLILEDDAIVRAATLTAERLAETVYANGHMAGRFAEDWSPTVQWSCLTGQAQMANVWLRLHEVLGENRWLEPVPAVLRYLKATQNRGSEDPGIRGGIKGSLPIDGGYGAYQILNWATKFFADALYRDHRVRTRTDLGSDAAEALA